MHHLSVSVFFSLSPSLSHSLSLSVCLSPSVFFSFCFSLSLPHSVSLSVCLSPTVSLPLSLTFTSYFSLLYLHLPLFCSLSITTEQRAIAWRGVPVLTFCSAVHPHGCLWKVSRYSLKRFLLWFISYLSYLPFSYFILFYPHVSYFIFFTFDRNLLHFILI